MLSRPDFEYKQLIVISSEDWKELSLINGNILISRTVQDEQGEEKKQKITQISCAKVFCIFIYGDVTLTTKIINELLDYNIRIYCMGSHGKPKFVIGNQLEGNTLLRQNQYTNTHELEYAKKIVFNKIQNQCSLLRDIRKKSEFQQKTLQQIEGLLKTFEMIDSVDSLRGVEGTVARGYFKARFEELGWYRREPRVRGDVLNTLLDMGYYMLYCIVESHLCLYGFDIYKGVYHTLFFERKSLVCDMVEPLRYLMDRQIKNCLNLGQISEDQFVLKNGQYELSREERKKIVKLLMEPIIERKMDIFHYIKSFYASLVGNNIQNFKDFK